MDANRRYLIVNADDFGQSRGVTRGIIAAHEHGIVTSTSLVVRWPAAAEAAAYARTHPLLSVGLHLDLGEWVYRDDTWVPLYEVVPLDDRARVAAEVQSQIETFRDLVGANPTHIDSHQHVHRRDPTHGIVSEIARSLAVPLRDEDAGVRYCGSFYGQTGTGDPLPDLISVDALLRLLAALTAGVTELGCHPAEGDDLDTMYRRERELELRTLCDPRVREGIASLGIALCSFRDVRQRRP
jgi:chitin disaccharide deacetylase